MPSFDILGDEFEPEGKLPTGTATATSRYTLTEALLRTVKEACDNACTFGDFPSFCQWNRTLASRPFCESFYFLDSQLSIPGSSKVVLGAFLGTNFGSPSSNG
jgi:hypothetical protein